MEACPGNKKINILLSEVAPTPWQYALCKCIQTLWGDIFLFKICKTVPYRGLYWILHLTRKLSLYSPSILTLYSIYFAEHFCVSCPVLRSMGGNVPWLGPMPVTVCRHSKSGTCDLCVVYKFWDSVCFYFTSAWDLGFRVPVGMCQGYFVFLFLGLAWAA